MWRLPLAVLLLGCACTLAAQPLTRRADTGAAVMPPSGGKPPHIVRFREGSVLERAGLRVGDALVALDGHAITDEAGFGRWRRLRSGAPVRVSAQRGGERLDVTVTPPAMVQERIDGIEVRYGEARSERGYGVRTYTTRPAGAQGRLPVVVFIPWLSCGPVETPFGASDGWSRMLRDVIVHSGMQVVRLEKPGIGDSEGPDCAESDLAEDLAAFRAGIRAALADPGADGSRLYLFGGSIGGALAPVLAAEFAARGVIVTGGFTRTWLEHMLDIERRRLTLSGKTPAEVNAAMRMFAGFYDEVLNRGRTPGEVLQARPEWKGHWYDAPAHQYGRPTRYYQQVQALDVEAAFAKLAVPTLVLWGEYDWIMGREESDRAVAILRARDPASVTYVVRPGMNHHFDVYPDALAAFKEEGGRYDAGAAQAIVAWLRAR